MKETPQEYAERKEREREEREERRREWEEREQEREDNRDAKRDLIAQARSVAHTTDWSEGSARIEELMAAWKAVGSVGKDYSQSFWDEFLAARQPFFDARQRARDQREQERSENRRAKENLVSRAAGLAGSTDWKSTSDEMAELFEEWKQIGPAGKDDDERLWGQFQSARQRFFDARKRHFQQQEEGRARNKAAKEHLIDGARNASGSTNWKAGGKEMDALMREWKAVGSAGREQEAELWDRFNAARRSFYDNRTQFYASRDAEHERNAAKKRALIARASDLCRLSDLGEARRKFGQLMLEWKQIGSTGKATDDLWDELSAVRATLFDNKPFGAKVSMQQSVSKHLDRHLSQANKSAAASIFGGYAPTFKGDEAAKERHHSDPKFLGGERRQPLTVMNRTDHRAFHKDERAFRQTYGQGNINDRDANLERLADQYELNKSKYPQARKDFFAQHPDREKAAEDRVAARDAFLKKFTKEN